MSPAWTVHHDPRAVVPPPAALESRDILSANTELALLSPSAIGLGISRVFESSSPQPFPLFYVSPQAAADRSPACSPRNAPGVRSGWYVIAEPGAQFELYVSMLYGADSVSRTSPDAQLLVFEISVDGTATAEYIIEPDEMGDISLGGFVETLHKDADTNLQRESCRRFTFCKTVTNDQGEDVDKDSGCIRLKLMTGMRGGEIARPASPFVEKYTLEHNLEVDEKIAVKNGISIGVRRDGELLSEVCAEPDYEIHSECPFPQGSITIFVRELFWLQSRRIIDNNCCPVKYKARVASEEVIDLDEYEDGNLAKGLKNPVGRIRKRNKAIRGKVINIVE